MVKEIITFLLNPLLNQRGQMLGMFPYQGNAMAPGNEEETRQYERFLTDEPSADYGELIAKYKNLMSGGAGSYDAYQELQTGKDLERIRNTQAARGLGGRSGVGVSAAAQYMGEAGPRHAMQKADYMGKLMSDYARATQTGRKGYGLAQTRATSKRGAPLAAGPGAGGGAAFQWPGSGGGGGGSTSRGGGGGDSQEAIYQKNLASGWYGSPGSASGSLYGGGNDMPSFFAPYGEAAGGGFSMPTNEELIGDFTGHWNPTDEQAAVRPGAGKGQLVGGGWAGQFGAGATDDYWNRPGPWQDQF